MLKPYVRLLRTSHWIKNLFVFAPVLFSKHFFGINYLREVALGFVIFSIVSSIVYIFNDIIDAEADRAHPVKKFRPIASGIVPVRNAVIFLSVLSLILVLLLFLTNIKFILAIIVYILLNVAYTMIFKHMVILDLMCIAGGFMLRVMGGGFIIMVPLSSWLILTTLFISLFLAVMKRRSELIYVTTGPKTRKVLEEYSLYFIDQVSSISAAGVILSYALYTVSPKTVANFNTENLVYSTIFVIFGIFRFMYLVFKKSKSENTVELILTDVPMILNIFLYSVYVIVVIYFQSRL